MAKLPTGYVQSTFRLSPELMREFKMALAANGESAQDVFTAAVQAYVTQHKEVSI